MKLIIFGAVVYCMAIATSGRMQSKKSLLYDILRFAKNNWYDLQVRENQLRSGLQQDNSWDTAIFLRDLPCVVGVPTDDEEQRKAWTKLKEVVATDSIHSNRHGCNIKSIKNAMIRFNNVDCNGIMISSRVGLTAAHCFISRNSSSAKKQSFSTEHGYASINFNPQFSYHETYNNVINDLATMNLLNDSNNSDLKCLLLSHDDCQNSPTCEECKVIVGPPFVEQSVTLKYCDDDVFKRDDILCATSNSKYQFEPGDSGSPVVCRYKGSSNWYVRGIVSYLALANKVAHIQLIVSTPMKLAVHCQFKSTKKAKY